ncbi:hypothetical protein N7481_002680 [Penicillium waksmanii]|uniref:uncharacterized protein n=1 Tax=Penicillium waksmanii TaxID=69791 RepID=UPI002547414E|nr:uncharacterized protein N7481_002680 [Penicillium waksmanii]KAJ5995703.1 hypothetical protein N7481_002680 [Penicillium waksmanii]
MYPGLMRTFNIHNPQMAIFFGQTESESESESHDKQTPPRPELSSEFPGAGHGVSQQHGYAALRIRIFNDAGKVE